MSAKITVVARTIFVALCLTLLPRSAALSQQLRPDVLREIKHDVSPPLRDIKPAPAVPGPPRLMHPHATHTPRIAPAQPDPVLQTFQGPPLSATVGLKFDGVDDKSQAAVSGFLVAPPDTNGAVGASQFVQWVNLAFAVFDKTTGAMIAHYPQAGNTLWSGFGGRCEKDNDGDPIAQYDKAAGRWVLTQPVFKPPFAVCIAVSQTSDATGSYNRYEFSMPAFPDYPKLGVWPDGYYMSVNLFSGNTFVGARLCAFDRSAMLAGSPATQVCFETSSAFPSLLPSDLDGLMLPPKGSPNFILNFGTNSLNLWKFHVDFENPANSTFKGPINIPVAAFNEACGGGVCIPQLGTRQHLDSLGDRLMYRLAYRHFVGDHEALVVNHSITAGSSVGVRWYEIRSPNATPTVFQHGTFAPDANFRWMGSIAMDHVGNIAVGYSVSSSNINPSIAFAGRPPTDPLGTLGETSITVGGGSQLHLNRWGDYSSMSVDPVDDCTFWYTTEYLKAYGDFNWSTRIASFKFDSCINSGT